MNPSLSLRARLTVVILAPLLIVAVVVGAWAYRDAVRNAADRFDRSLLSTALAISRDTAATGGDALSEETRDLLRDTSGGAVFYHVYAPDGVFVTGYATPPVPPDGGSVDTGQSFYDAVYFGSAVRALRVTQLASMDGLSGLYTFTVWQATDVRDGFVRTRTVPLFAIIASLVGALAIIVWFGVGRGLAPLVSLEEAIARRSVDDLSPIKRRIPNEVTGIVGRFNALLSDLSASMTAKDVFISDAAHQLRNPIAGVIALADSVANAKTVEAAQSRAQDLQAAAQELGHLTNSLLTLERIKADAGQTPTQPFDPIPILNTIAAKTDQAAQKRKVAFHAVMPTRTCTLVGDAVMFEQAVLNVLDNALSHGGPSLTRVDLSADHADQALRITVQDDGRGIAPSDYPVALGRFSQVGPSAGSGLGLPIAAAVVDRFDGTIDLGQDAGLFRVTMTLPVSVGAV